MWRKFTIEVRDRTNITDPVFMYSNNILEKCTVDLIRLYIPSNNITLENLFKGKKNAPDLEVSSKVFIQQNRI